MNRITDFFTNDNRFCRLDNTSPVCTLSCVNLLHSSRKYGHSKWDNRHKGTDQLPCQVHIQMCIHLHHIVNLKQYIVNVCGGGGGGGDGGGELVFYAIFQPLLVSFHSWRNTLILGVNQQPSVRSWQLPHMGFEPEPQRRGVIRSSKQYSFTTRTRRPRLLWS